MAKTRREKDSFGTVEVPEGSYWGAQTARSLLHFSIGEDRMSRSLIRALGIVKKAAAEVNAETGGLDKKKEPAHHPSLQRSDRWRA